jgi:hypothetical protein
MLCAERKAPRSEDLLFIRMVFVTVHLQTQLKKGRAGRGGTAPVIAAKDQAKEVTA